MEYLDSLQFKPVSNDQLAQIMADLNVEEDIDRIVTTMALYVVKSFNNTERIEQIVQDRFAELAQSGDWGDWSDEEIDDREAAPTEGPVQAKFLAPKATAREDCRNRSSGSLQGRGGSKSGSWSSSRGKGNQVVSDDVPINRPQRTPTEGPPKKESWTSVAPAREGGPSGYLSGRGGESTGSLPLSRGHRAPWGRSGPSRGRQEAGPMIDNEWAAKEEVPEEEKQERHDKAHMKPVKVSDFWK